MKRQIIGVDIFSAESIRNCEEYIFSMQQKLDKAVVNNDKKSIREIFDLLTKKSSAVKELATWRITQRNDGKHTAGIDGISLPKGLTRQEQNQFRHNFMNEIDISRKPDAIKRVYIPKANGKQRPLGIPTIRDRIIQEILRIAIEPIAEYHFHGNSYGFRPHRSCQDAMMHIHLKMCRNNSPTYVIEGDIKGCFDNIKHSHIIETLDEWNVPKWCLEHITSILKSGIYTNGEIYDSDTGTPQGGVISPLLANVALTSLDYLCDDLPTGYYQKASPMVRYADDFIIISQKEPIAREIKTIIADHLQDKTGLELSDEKTKITHIQKGFNFLGFNFKKYEIMKKGGAKEYALYIQPEKEKTQNLLTECRKLIKRHSTVSQENLIRILRPKIIGWGMYYRFVNNRYEQFRFDRLIWHNLKRWGKRRHPKKSNRWVREKYFVNRPNTRIWEFGIKEQNNFFPRLSEIPKKMFIKVNNKYRVYDKDAESQEYWRKREYVNAYNQIETVRRQKLFKRQKGKCYHCKKSFNEEDLNTHQVHTHHIIPKKQGGNDNYNNLRLVHTNCHWEIHASR